MRYTNKAQSILVSAIVTLAVLVAVPLCGCGVPEDAAIEKAQSQQQVPADTRLDNPSELQTPIPVEYRNCYHCDSRCDPDLGRRCCYYDSNGHAKDCRWRICSISWTC